MLAIEITDSGIGMTPDTAARAFDLFAQAGRTPDRSSGEIDLGLSQGLEKGSTFTVRCRSCMRMGVGARSEVPDVCLIGIGLREMDG